jgi:hypothetical protein
MNTPRPLRRCMGNVLAFALVLLCGGEAYASDYPEEYVKRPQVVTQGMLQLRGALDFNLSKGSAFDPVVLAPSFEYGITDDLQIALRHENSICFGDACKFYDDMSLDAKYLFLREETFSLSFFAGPNFASFDPFFMRAEAGLGFWAIAGEQFAINASLGVGVGLNRRSVDVPGGSIATNPDTLQLALQPAFNFTREAVGFVNTGFRSSFQAFGDAWSIPFGIGGFYTIEKSLDLGAQLTFPAVVAANDGGTLDARELGLLVRYRFETQR